jgi:hypothetical protein
MNDCSPNVCMQPPSKNGVLLPDRNVQEPFDPFDVSRLRLSQDFLAAAGVKKVLNTIPVRKPSKEWFIRTHPDQDYHIHTYVIELKEDSEVYLVDPSLWEGLISEACFGPRALITTINRQNVVTLWNIRLPGADGKIDDWNRSTLEASSLAATKWVRVAANKNLGAYEVFEAMGSWGEPSWNLPSFQEVLRIAFKDRFIKALDHPVLRRLRGEA